jgi:hypothetical protein
VPRALVFSHHAPPAPDIPADELVVVLSPWWTPPPGTPPTIVGVRPLAARVLGAVDVPAAAHDGLDRWAHATGVADQFLFDGISWWDRVRMAVRWDVYELVLWTHLLADLGAASADVARVPADRPQLAAACRVWGLRVEETGTAGEASGETHGHDDGHDLHAQPAVVAPTPPAPRPSALRRPRAIARSALVRLGLREPPPPKLTRRQRLDLRFEALAAQRPILALTWAGALQVLGDDPTRRGDPFIDPAIARLAEGGEAVAMVALGRNHRDPDDWAVLRDDPRMLPFSYVRARERRDDDPDLDEAPIVLPEMAASGFPVGGRDLAPAVLTLLDAYTGTWLATRRQWGTWAGRFLDELRPRALLIDREGTRADWIGAAQQRGIPVIAVQHGMIYRGNPEYFRTRIPGSLVPDRTCVFGPWERDLLVREAGFEPRSVVVIGSPRAPGSEPAARSARDRGAVRGSLGVRDDDRLLTVSAAHNPMGELITACMLGSTLDGPLPGVHVAVKAHPQDREPGDYPALFAGLAAAGGYDPPPVTVIRDIDLTRLLAASDAHLGHSSTVLTDAVAVGVPNLVAVGQAQADQLGYAAHGVATAVRSVDDVRACMADPRAPSAEVRAAFLADHFLPGDATGRLADVVLDAIQERAGAPQAEGTAS